MRTANCVFPFFCVEAVHHCVRRDANALMRLNSTTFVFHVRHDLNTCDYNVFLQHSIKNINIQNSKIILRTLDISFYRLLLQDYTEIVVSDQ